MSPSKHINDATRLDSPADVATNDPQTPSVEEKRERERLFKQDNADAFASMNEWVERHGLPLEKYRPF